MTDRAELLSSRFFFRSSCCCRRRLVVVVVGRAREDRRRRRRRRRSSGSSRVVSNEYYAIGNAPRRVIVSVFFVLRLFWRVVVVRVRRYFLIWLRPAKNHTPPPG